MKYYLAKKTRKGFEEAETEVRDKLKDAGFGIITEIDMQATFKKKLGVDFKRYKILGACNPNYAYEAVQKEEHIGALLPCNVYLIEQPDHSVEIGAIDPEMMIGTIDNPELKTFATEVKDRLVKALEAVPAS
jgi:uncharacterized protein (DUF302 family)